MDELPDAPPETPTHKRARVDDESDDEEALPYEPVHVNELGSGPSGDTADDNPLEFLDESGDVNVVKGNINDSTLAGKKFTE
ncbi:hypothetical protein HRS9122_00003 [Pyrenophora teres f. teres]|nr:hypothetical protein HRS9122_00003 [Pyrenophora teres f. teres]